MLTQALVVSGPMDFNAENGTKKKMCGLSALQVIYSQERSEEKCAFLKIFCCHKSDRCL